MKQKGLTALCALALAGAIAVPAAAAGAPSPVFVPAASAYAMPVSQYEMVFSGVEALTREQLVSALHQREGSPVVNYAMGYSDVDAGASYAEAVRWASSEKLVSGYDNGCFGPNDPVTREQLAVILYRYAQRSDLGFTGAWAFPLGYEDAASINAYAYEAVCWMTMHHIMEGTQDNLFVPQATVSGDQADAILTQFFSVMEEQLQLANPYVEDLTLEQAAQIAGFSLSLPAKAPDWAEQTAIRAVEDSLIEVVYQGGEQELTVRKGAGSEDVSGDYTAYPESGTVQLNGHPVTWKGENGAIRVAVWQDGGYSYAVTASSGLELEALTQLVTAIA